VIALVVVVLVLGGPGLVPALAIARRSPVLIFLAPLTGAAMAAIAAELELAVGGSLTGCYALVAAFVNLAVIGWWLAAGRSGSPARPAESGAGGAGWGRYLVTVATLLAAVAVPLAALRGHAIGWDSNSIWLTHALMLSGGHHELLTSVQNRAYAFSNPDYPPLVPAAGALAFGLFGVGDLLIAVQTTAFLTACAVGAAAAGIATAGAAGHARPLTRLATIAAAGAFCIAGFAVSSRYGTDGHADLMWAAAAVAAIVWGLVLPRSREAFLIAWICAIAASLTKNEGLVTALIVLALIALRYRPLKLARPLHPRDWAERAALLAVPALPGLAWAGLARLIGLQDAFFGHTSAESLSSRASATTYGLASQLRIVPVAVAVLAAGCLVLRGQRQNLGLGNPAWLWTAGVASLATLFLTYVVGTDPIQWWLQTSMRRTTIFAQILLYADLAVWLVLAIARTSAPEPDSRARGGVQAKAAGAPPPATLARSPVSQASDLTSADLAAGD
jgi:hypothetical protein